MIIKRVISSLLLSAMLINTAAVYAATIEDIKTLPSKLNVSKQKELNDIVVPKKLEAEMKASIAHVYGKENADIIYDKVYDIIVKAKNSRGNLLVDEDWQRPSDWYKDEIIYMFYPDQFGVSKDGKPSTFKSLIGMLDYLKDLGVTTIYILPFADSPMNDAGFDVRNPKNVRADLGGMYEFQQFAAEARKKGFKLKADLVLNHFSDQHEWFQQALNGDLSKLDYFIVKTEMPVYKRYKDEKLGYVAEYTESDGSISKRRIIFPEITENNYRKVTIKGKDYYVYHTFYPFQPDINWENPEVLYYVLDVIAFWANMGIDIFRMDAIPYLDKTPGTNAENQPKTHEIIKLLSAFLQTVSPRSIIQAEACQQPKKNLAIFRQ